MGIVLGKTAALEDWPQGHRSAPMPLVPVLPLNEAGEIVAPHYAAIPCIRIAYSFQMPTPDLRTYGLRSVLALIDTGADGNFLARECFPEVGGDGRTAPVFGVTGTHQAEIREVALYVAEAALTITGSVHSFERRPHQPYQMILGRNFLQAARFRWDGHLGVCDFEIFNNPLAV